MGFIFDADVPIPASSGKGPFGPRSTTGFFVQSLMDQPIGASGIAPAGVTSPMLGRTLIWYGGKGWFVTRKTPEGVRVWKITEPTKKRNG